MSVEIERTVSVGLDAIEQYAGACLTLYRETGDDYYMGAADALKQFLDIDVIGLSTFRSRLSMNHDALQVAKEREAAQREAKENLTGGGGRG